MLCDRLHGEVSLQGRAEAVAQVAGHEHVALVGCGLTHVAEHLFQHGGDYGGADAWLARHHYDLEGKRQ